MLIARAEPSGELLYLQSVADIGGEDVVPVLVVGAVFTVELIIVLCRFQLFVAVVLRSIVAHDVLHTGFEGVQLAYRSGVVGLESMFGRILRAVVMLVLHSCHEVLPAGCDVLFVIVVGRIGVRVFRPCIDFVGECQHAVFYAEHALIVDSSVDRIP